MAGQTVNFCVEYYDCNGLCLQDGDVIDLHQTVNGQNLFIVLSVKNLDVRYKHDFRKYEYSVGDLLKEDIWTVEWEIVDNIFN